jgi:hypothetical protein
MVSQVGGHPIRGEIQRLFRLTKSYCLLFLNFDNKMTTNNDVTG